MMKNTVLALGIGFLIGRHIYKNYDRKEAEIKEAQLKRRLINTLHDLGLSNREISAHTKHILK